MKKTNSLFRLLLLISLCLLMTSCELFTWLSFRRQMRKVDKNFQIVRQGNRDHIIFLKPILDAGNVKYVTNKEASQVRKKDDGTLTYYYHCKRQRKNAMLEHDLTWELYFNKEGKVSGLQGPFQFSRDLDYQSYQKATSALLSGEVSNMGKTLTSEYDNKSLGKIKSLSRDNIIFRFGAPDKEENKNLYYSYLIDTPSKVDIKSRTVLVQFTLNKNSKVRKIRLDFASITLHFEYL